MNLFSRKSESYDGVIGLLREDHEKLKDLFEQFEETEDQGSKRQIVDTTLKLLTAHAVAEEEVFYPAVREADTGDEEVNDLMDEAIQEHHIAKVLIAELERMKPSDQFYDAKFTVLAESVKHHIEEEESDVFPKVQDDGTNWEEVATRLKQRRKELLKSSSQPNGRSGGGRSSRKPPRTRRTMARRTASARK